MRYSDKRISRSSILFGAHEDDVWYDADQLFMDHIIEANRKLVAEDLEDDIWGKVILMERNERVAKAYLRHPVVTINGSMTQFDGLTIGWKGFSNPDRDDKVDAHLHRIGAGVTLRMDQQGNVDIKRSGRDCPVYVYGATLPDSCLSAEIMKAYGRIDIEKKVKVFDMAKFKKSIDFEMSEKMPDPRRLMYKTMVAISLVKQTNDLLTAPCWVLLINLVALEMLNSRIPKQFTALPSQLGLYPGTRYTESRLHGYETTDDYAQLDEVRTSLQDVYSASVAVGKNDGSKTATLPHKPKHRARSRSPNPTNGHAVQQFTNNNIAYLDNHHCHPQSIGHIDSMVPNRNSTVPSAQIDVSYSEPMLSPRLSRRQNEIAQTHRWPSTQMQSTARQSRSTTPVVFGLGDETIVSQAEEQFSRSNSPLPQESHPVVWRNNVRNRSQPAIRPTLQPLLGSGGSNQPFTYLPTLNRYQQPNSHDRQSMPLNKGYMSDSPINRDLVGSRARSESASGLLKRIHQQRSVSQSNEDIYGVGPQGIAEEKRNFSFKPRPGDIRTTGRLGSGRINNGSQNNLPATVAQVPTPPSMSSVEPTPIMGKKHQALALRHPAKHSSMHNMKLTMGGFNPANYGSMGSISDYESIQSVNEDATEAPYSSVWSMASARPSSPSLISEFSDSGFTEGESLRSARRKDGQSIKQVTEIVRPPSSSTSSSLSSDSSEPRLAVIEQQTSGSSAVDPVINIPGSRNEPESHIAQQPEPKKKTSLPLELPRESSCAKVNALLGKPSSKLEISSFVKPSTFTLPKLFSTATFRPKLPPPVPPLDCSTEKPVAQKLIANSKPVPAPRRKRQMVFHVKRRERNLSETSVAC